MKLLTVDLEAPLPDIPPPAVGEQWVLVRFHREPLGMLYFSSGGCSAGELAAEIARGFSWRIMRHLARDSFHGGALPASDDLPRVCPRHQDVDLPRLTVAVCTRDGAHRLGECLRSLDTLKYPADRLDLLVVDNSPSDDSTASVVARHPRVRYVVEPRPGLNWARNRAVLEAAGDVIAFTDDDVSVDVWWADALGRLFAADPQVDAVTGLVVPDEIDVEAQRLFERYGGFGRGFDRQYFHVNAAAGEATARRHGGTGRFGTGANMAFRRTLVDRIGLFDPALDVGTPTNGGGDLEMFFRVLKERGTLVYEPAAIVRHRHRRSYEQLRTQLANNGIGFYSYLVRTARVYRDERPSLLRLGAWWLWWWNLRRLVRSFIGRSDVPRDLIVAELKGSLLGLRRYSAAVRRAASIARTFGPQHPYASTANGA
ncbi:MAG TPA: glycosyltransferase [Vicinamibacterales bacterium]|nr:glycosyltransferase [Vicinamibacterales bacterium]